MKKLSDEQRRNYKQYEANDNHSIMSRTSLFTGSRLNERLSYFHSLEQQRNRDYYEIY
jgi:hypothetical protein